MNHIKSLALILTAILAIGVGCEPNNNTNLISGGGKNAHTNNKNSHSHDNDDPEEEGVKGEDILPDTHDEANEDPKDAAGPTKVSGYYGVNTPRDKDFSPLFSLEVNNIEGKKSVSGTLVALGEGPSWHSGDRMDVIESDSTFDGSKVNVVFAGTVGEQPTLLLEWNFDASAEYTKGTITDKDSGEKLYDVEINKQDMSHADDQNKDLGPYEPDDAEGE